jgi:membrane protease YdiL (CAAX protease family)
MKRWLLDAIAVPLRQIEDEQREFLLSERGRQVDYEVILTLVTAAVALTIQYYCFTEYRPTGWLLSVWPEHAELVRHGYWAFGQIVAYVLVPLPVIVLVFRRSPRDYGLKLRGVLANWWVYALMYLVMLPLLIWLSGNDRFLRTYPFYRLADGESLWPGLILWELIYALQFVALEFFFRGFLVHGTKRRFGVYAVFAMAFPYCMIHFGKPMPETLGAIVAGIVLGFMSLKTGSVGMGAALHIAIAWTMDGLAIWRAG